MKGPTLAIVDDDQDFSAFMAHYAERRGFNARQLHTVADATPWLSRHHADLTLLDMALPDGSGLDIIERMRPDHRGHVVFISGTNDPEEIRRAVATPASEFIGKPVCEDTLHRLLEQTYARFVDRVRNEGHAVASLLGESADMLRVRQDIEQAGPSLVNVLITGETGTGKELVARALHEASGRQGNLVSVNCGAVAPELLASQMFGHERGSFTGAFARHLGWFEQAEGGTLFLDEIGDMPPALQVYLLRVLETRRITRIGGSQEIPVDVRVIAATHNASGPGLRDDLYYRLARYVIELPPLRNRGADVELLASSFVRALDADSRGPARQLDPACIPLLHQHAWPGNVRQLAAAVEQAYLRSGGRMVYVQPPASCRIECADEPDDDELRFRVGMTFREVEDLMLERTLAFHGGDKTATARSLGISVRTVHNHVARGRPRG